MLYTYLKLSLRNILKHKSFTFINVTGLAIGLAACLVLAQYAYQQHTYDAYHSQADRIYRTGYTYTKDGGEPEESIYISNKVLDKLMTQVPEVEESAWIKKIDYYNNTMVYMADDGPVSYNETNVFITTSKLFTVFDLPLQEGSIAEFDAPGKIVLSSETARKYFGTGTAVGKKVQLNGNIGSFTYEIVAVAEPLPENTHLDFNILITSEANKDYNPNLTNDYYMAYLLLAEGSNTEAITEILDKIHLSVFPGRQTGANEVTAYELQPLTRLQLYYPQFSAFKKSADAKTVNILAAIAVVILLIAWFNYINLSTVRAMERAREIGIRKILGSAKKHILMQFIIESVVINLFAVLIAFTLIQLTAPLLDEMLSFQVSFSLDLRFWTLFSLAFFAGTFLSAAYPAAIMTGFSPLAILNKRLTLNHGGMGFRKLLVVLQFAVSVVLIAATVTVYRQVSHMTSADLGMNINDMIIIKSPPSDLNNGNGFFRALGTFKTEMERNTVVDIVTTSSSIPGKSIGWGSQIVATGQPAEEAFSVKMIACGKGFDKAYNLQLKAGRLVKEGDNPWGNGHVLVNEETVRLLGFAKPEDAIGTRITSSMGGASELIIKGVVGNHSHMSVKEGFQPVMYMASGWANYFTVKLNIADDAEGDSRLAQVNSAVNLLENTWQEVFPQATLDFYFLDQEFDNLYKKDRQFGMIFLLFSGLAIVIASLGLLGLSSFTIARRTKEIGVRKVMGATDLQVIKLLSGEYLLLVILANLVAVPLSWYLLSEWLQNYQYRIGLGWWLAAVPLVVVTLIALLTISIRVLKVAGKNPVDSLRYE